MRKLMLIFLTLIAVFLSFNAYGKTSYTEGANRVELANHYSTNLKGPKPKNNSRLTEKPTSRQNSEWEVIGSWPYGACNTVIADSNYVYIGTGGVIIIADMTDPSAPVELSRIVTPGAVWKLFKSGNHLYVANKMAGFRIIDVSDPLNPVEVGSFEKQYWGWESARDVCVFGSYAYLAMDGLYILDVSDPSNPVEVAHLYIGWVWDIYISSNYAYVTSSGGLRIFDISDPSNPVEISSYLNLFAEARVYVSNGYAYVTNVHKGFYIVDVNNPLNPVEVAHLYTSPDWVWDVHGSGSYVYVVTHDSGLHILDVSDPANPKEVGSYHDVSADWEDIYVYGSYVYMTFSDGGVRIIDVIDPSSPMKVGYFSTSGTVMDVFISGRYAYVASGDFHILDINDPSNPREVGSVISVNIFEKETRAVHVSGNYAYVNGNEPCLRILDISDPSNPVEVSTYSTDCVGALARGLFISGNYAYLLGFLSGLHIIDVSDPSNPVEIGRFDASGPTGIYVSGSYAYVTYAHTGMPDNYRGLRILDVSNPSNPAQVGSIDISSDCFSVHVSLGYAHVTAGDSRLHIIDSSNPSNPIEVANYYKEGGANFSDVYVSGDYAYVACVPFGLIILDVNNPSNPIEAANVNKIEARGVYVYCGYIYVVEEEFGIVVVKNMNDILHALSIESGLGGTTDPAPETYSYDCGTEVTIKAIPESGYRFSEWSGDVSGTDNPITITMDSDKSIKANFTQTQTESDEKGGGGCFIATACYGTPMAEEVKTLCAFRDQYLVKNPIGRVFVNFYYSYSPKVADFIKDREDLKVIVRECLKPIVWIIASFGINS